MIDVFNMTQAVAAAASAGLSNFLSAVLAIFSAAVIAYLAMEYFHNKHIENLAKQMMDSTNMNVQAIQHMVITAITAKQGMDITDKVIGTPGPSAEKKTQ